MIKINNFLRLSGIAVLTGFMLFTSACGGSSPKVEKKVSAPKDEDTKAKGDVVEAAGKIKANEVKNIVLDFSASIENINVKEGQRVKSGQELITLDIHEIRQQINNKESDLKQIGLQLQISTNDLEAEEKELSRKLSEYDTEKDNNVSIQLKESEYQTAKDELSRADEDLSKKKPIYEAGALSKTELDTAQRRYDDAVKRVSDKGLALDDIRNTRKQTLDKLQTAITQEKSKVSDQKINIEIQKQKIETLTSDLKLLKDKINRSYLQENKVISDIKNALVQDIVHVDGDTIAPNTKVLSLIDMDSLIVEAEVSEDFVKDVKVGALVDIYPLSDSNKQYKGKVNKIADMGVEKNGETFVLTEISIDNMDEFVKPNLSVDVKIGK